MKSILASNTQRKYRLIHCSVRFGSVRFELKPAFQFQPKTSDFKYHSSDKNVQKVIKYILFFAGYHKI